MTLDEVLKMTGWSKAYALKRASLDRWERLGTRPQEWKFDDVLRSCPDSKDERVKKHLVRKYSRHAGPPRSE